MNPAAIVVKVVHECAKVRRSAYAGLQCVSGRQLSAVSIRSEVECVSATTRPPAVMKHFDVLAGSAGLISEGLRSRFWRAPG